MSKTLKPIPHYEGLYSIDIQKNIFSHITNSYLKPYKTGFDEVDAKLTKDCKSIDHKVEDLYIITHKPKSITNQMIERFERKIINKKAIDMARSKRKFSSNQIKSIREEHTKYEISIDELSNKYDVSQNVISKIVSYKTYQDIA